MRNQSPPFQFIADRGDARLRLDQVLVRRVRDVRHFSRTRARQWIEAGAVAVDGRVTSRAALRVHEGASVAVSIPASAVRREVPGPEALALDILYEDEFLIAINKPAGMVVHPSYKRHSGTLLNAVLGRLDGRSSTPGILTRLDKDTSGIVIVALSPDVHAALQTQSRAGHLKKEYLAVVHGVPRPRSGHVRLPLARDPTDRRRVVVLPEGAASETVYEVIASDDARDGGRSLVRCTLVTGRTHQIRVHLASNGWPIVGDATYGRKADGVGRQALHAWRITFVHPASGERCTLVAPLPADMLAVAGVLLDGVPPDRLTGRA
jgi:23S rRNA pseudouridine1911/1915/1917 synthase